MAEEAKKDEKEKAGEAGAESPEQDAKKRKKKLLIFAILGFLVVAGGGAGAFIFLSGGKKKADGHEQEISKASVEAEHGGDEGHGEKPEKAKAEEGHGEEKPKDEHGGGDGHDKAAADSHGGKAEAPAAGAKEGEQGAAAGGEKKVQVDIDFGETFKMQSFNLNLGNALENRYIRLEVSLEYRGGDPQKQEIEKRMPQLRDAVIGIVQRKTREFLLSPDGKESLRKEILTRINRYMKTRIESVYITDLLIE